MLRLFLFIYLLPFLSYAQNHPASDASNEVSAKCKQLTSIQTPVKMEEGLMLNEVTCKDGSLIYELYLTDYELEESKVESLKTGFHNAFYENLKIPYFEDFKKLKWQIGYLIFDKNKKYVCGLIYDVGDSNQYLRNPMVEQFLNTVYQNTDEIDN